MQHTAVIQRAAYTCNNDRTADNVLVARNDHVAYNIPSLGDAVRRSGGSSFDQHTHKPRRMRSCTGVYPDAILQVPATKNLFLRNIDLDECKRQCFVGKCRAFDHFPTGDCLLDNSVGDVVAPTAAPNSTATSAASCDSCEGAYKRCIGSWGPTNSYAPWLALATESSKSSLCNCLQETVVCLRRIIECASQVTKELGLGSDWLHPPSE